MCFATEGRENRKNREIRKESLVGLGSASLLQFLLSSFFMLLPFSEKARKILTIIFFQ